MNAISLPSRFRYRKFAFAFAKKPITLPTTYDFAAGVIRPVRAPIKLFGKLILLMTF